jgi:RecA/RadA recombinase
MAKKEKAAQVTPEKKLSLKERILKNSTIKETALVSESKLFKEKDVVSTPVPMVNVALSGKVDGGMGPGVLMLAGPSKHFKTGYGLLIISSFLKKYPEGTILFYDSEFGSPESYFQSYGIPTDNVVHSPVTDIEMLKHDIMVQLKELSREDNVLIFIDSVGNLASVKEINDTLEGKQVADMTRAKSLKSLWRMVTPHLTIKNIPLVAINHTYKTQEMYSKDVVSGGTGGIYNSENIWIIGRQQDKTDKDGLLGYHFVIKVEKSRYVREGSKIPITVSFGSGIDQWSGLWELAEEFGYIKPSKIQGKMQGYVTIGDALDEPIKKDALITSKNFYQSLLQDKAFVDFIEKKYLLESDRPMFDDGDVIDSETGEVLEEV